MLDHARPDLNQALSYGRELALGERARLGDRGTHAMHQPERGGVEDEPHLIGGRADTTRASDANCGHCHSNAGLGRTDRIAFAYG